MDLVGALKLGWGPRVVGAGLREPGVSPCID